MPRFLHTADWQIGRRYAQFAPDDAAPIAEQRIETVGRIARLAAERGVDAVLVAGDVFDTQTVGERLIRQLFKAMAAYEGPWVLIPGNHDAALGESVWTQAVGLNDVVPGNVTLALTPGTILLEACQTAVLTAPLTQRHTYNDTTAFFDLAATPDGWLRVGLAHGSVEGVLAEDIDSANPIAADRCARARLDYLALGDWHGLKLIEPRCAYSGTPEPERFRDNAPGHCLIVDLAGPGAVPVIEPVRVGRYRWTAVDLTISVPSDIDAIEARLATLTADDIVQLRIRGRAELAGRRRLLDLIGRAEAVARSLRVDLADLRLEPTADDIARLNADGYLAEVIEELREAQGSALPGDEGSEGGQGSDGGQGSEAGAVERAQPASDPSFDAARVAREALAILCATLDQGAVR